MLLTLYVLYAAVLAYNLNKGNRSKDVPVSAKGLLFENLLLYGYNFPRLLSQEVSPFLTNKIKQIIRARVQSSRFEQNKYKIKKNWFISIFIWAPPERFRLINNFIFI